MMHPSATCGKDRHGMRKAECGHGKCAACKDYDSLFEQCPAEEEHLDKVECMHHDIWVDSMINI